MQPTLVILAAGMASRYGSMKQVESFGPSGETIMDYSIYDAIEAGFERVVFIIREDFADTFKAIFEPKLKGRIITDYVYQKLTSFTEGFAIPQDRIKPWGTAHAVLCCKGKVDEPFAVINADDFYGKDAFIKAKKFLMEECNTTTYGLMGYKLPNTLSEHGSVSRGVVTTNDKNKMAGIDERLTIYREDNGQIVFEDSNGKTPLSDDTVVSMNFFCYDKSYIDLCDQLFPAFLQEHGNELKSEFLLPRLTDEFIKSGRGVVDIIPTSAKWFGVTYKEDAPVVKASVARLVESGEYPSHLWA